MPLTQKKKELHVGLEIPTHTARKIHNWALNQPWPEGTELEHQKEYHITLLYSTEGHDEHKDAWWIEHMDQAEITIKGVTAFPSRERGGYAYVLLIDSPEIDAKAEEMQGRAEWAGLPITRFDGGYKAHLTVAYGPSQKLPGVKAPNFQFDVGPSSVSPPRPKKEAGYKFSWGAGGPTDTPGDTSPPGIEDWMTDYVQGHELIDWVKKHSTPAPTLYRGTYWYGDQDWDRATQALMTQGTTFPNATDGYLVSFSADRNVAESFAAQGEFGFLFVLNGLQAASVDQFVTPKVQYAWGKQTPEHEWLVAIPQHVQLERYEDQPGLRIFYGQVAGKSATASRPPSPPYYRKQDKPSEHCGNCKMQYQGQCWGFGNVQIESDHVCDEWFPEEKRSAYNPSSTEVLDHLSLTNVAANLHYKFGEGGLDAAGATDYASRMLKLIGYPQDEITIQAALQAWQQMYPQDKVLDSATQSEALQAPPTTPTESYHSRMSGSPEKLAVGHRELSQSIRQSGLEQYAEWVPISELEPLREYDRRPGAEDRSAAADPEYWNKLRRHIETHGIEEPLSLEYNPHEGTGYLGEGNHRLAIAKEIGMTHVPAYVYRSTKTAPSWPMKQMHEPGTYLMPDARGFSQFGQYMKPSDIGLGTGNPWQRPGDDWYQQQLAERDQQHNAHLASGRPLYHWVDASQIHDWMDTSHTGPGETWLTETGDDPSVNWNPDVPRMDNPVRLTINPNELDQAYFDPYYEGWLGNHLYRGAIPPHAIEDIKAFKRPEEWDQDFSTVPTQVNDPEDHWPEFGDLSPSQQYHDVGFSNDWGYKTTKVSEVLDALDQWHALAAAHTGQLPGDEHLMGAVNVEDRNLNAGINPSWIGTVGHRDTGAQTPAYIKLSSGPTDLARERAAYVVAHHLGVSMPQTVVRQIPHPEGLNRGQGVVPVYAQVQRSLGGRAVMNDYLPAELAEFFPQEARNIHLLDSVIGNGDRHMGNLVIGDDGHLYPIDHGIAFNPFTFSPFKKVYGQQPLTDDEIARLERIRHLDLSQVGLDRGEQASFQKNIGDLLFERRYPGAAPTVREYTPQVPITSAIMASSMNHIHITENGETIGTLFLGQDGTVHDDGSKAAINVADHMNHGHKRQHGQQMLDAIVKHLDGSTRVHAHHCQEHHAR